MSKVPLYRGWDQGGVEGSCPTFQGERETTGSEPLDHPASPSKRLRKFKRLCVHNLLWSFGNPNMYPPQRNMLIAWQILEFSDSIRFDLLLGTKNANFQQS